METIDLRLGETGRALSVLEFNLAKIMSCNVSLEPSMTQNPPMFSKTLTVWHEKDSIGFTIKHSRDGETIIHLYRVNPFDNLADSDEPHLTLTSGELGVRTMIDGTVETFEVPEVLDYKELIQLLLEQFPEELVFVNVLNG